MNELDLDLFIDIFTCCRHMVFINILVSTMRWVLVLLLKESWEASIIYVPTTQTSNLVSRVTILENNLLDKIFAKPSYPCVAEEFGGKNLANAVKLGVTIIIILCAIFNTGQNISVIKFSPMRSGSEIGEHFLLSKICSYMI